jgi:Ni,Fe-hydrogenase III small subunit
MHTTRRIFAPVSLLEIHMSLLKNLMFAGACALSGGVFAASHTAAPAAAPMAPAATTPAATAPAAMPAKMTHAERKAAKKQIDADEKMAKAECKKLSGAEKSACKKEASAKEKTAKAELKAKP